VRLHARLGKHLTISRPSKFGEARKHAEYLARWLRLPLTDETTDHAIVLAAERAGDSLHERFHAEPANEAPPECPHRMRSQVFESGREVKIMIPDQSNMSGGSFAALFKAVMLLVFFPLLRRLLRHRRRAPLPPQVLLLIIAIFIVPATLLFIGLVPSKRKGTTVKASPAGLEIDLTTRWGSPVRTVPADQILDVDFSTFGRRAAG